MKRIVLLAAAIIMLCAAVTCSAAKEIDDRNGGLYESGTTDNYGDELYEQVLIDFPEGMQEVKQYVDTRN